MGRWSHVIGVLMRRWPSEDRHTGDNAMFWQRQRLEWWGMPRTAKVTVRRLEDARKDPTLQVSEGAWPSWHLDFRPLVSRMYENICTFKPPPPAEDGIVWHSLQRASERPCHHSPPRIPLNNSYLSPGEPLPHTLLSSSEGLSQHPKNSPVTTLNTLTLNWVFTSLATRSVMNSQRWNTGK